LAVAQPAEQVFRRPVAALLGIGDLNLLVWP
jgi:hypothetical protein